jgi:hypothetical protein
MRVKEIREGASQTDSDELPTSEPLWTSRNQSNTDHGDQGVRDCVHFDVS